MSLSMVLGSVTTFSPACFSRRAFFCVPPPPMQIEGVEMVAVVRIEDRAGHVADLAADLHLVRLVAAGAQDRAAAGEDAGEHGALQGHRAVVDQAAKAVAEADQFHVEDIAGGFAHAADGRIQTRTIAAAGEDSNLLQHVFILERTAVAWNTVAMRMSKRRLHAHDERGHATQPSQRSART